MSENAQRKKIDAMRGSGPSAFAPPIAQLLGMRAVSFDDGNAVLELDAGVRHANPMGTLHGGVLCDLADLAMGAACHRTLQTGESFTTLELKINFLKPIWTGRLTARAQVKKGGRTTALLECEIRDEKGVSQVEAAKHLGVSVSGMKSRTPGGRAQLRELQLRCCEVEIDRRGGVASFRSRSGGCGSGGGCTPAS